MKILLVNQYAGSPSLGMEFRPHWMALEWQRLGHEVLVVCGDHSHLRARIPQGMRAVEGVRYLALRTTSYSTNGPARFLNIVSFGASLRAASRRLVSWNPDLVIASSTHPMDVRAAHQVARRSSAPFVYEVHDLWPLTPQLLGGFSERHPMIRWMAREERFGYEHCDQVVSLLPLTERYMREHGLRSDRWTWVPNGIPDQRDAADKPLTALPARLVDARKLHERLLVYAGTIGRANDLDRLLKHLPLCKDLGIGVVLVGDGPERRALQQRYERSPNLVWIGQVPKTDVPALLAQTDVAYIGLASSPLFSHGISPNKLFDYMDAGLPIIENVGAANSPATDADCGWAIHPDDEESLARALREASAMSARELREIGARGRRFVRANYSQSTLARALLRVALDEGANAE